MLMILVLGVLLVGVGGAEVELLDTDQTVLNTFTTIQECSDLVSPGQTCLVHEGNYTERVEINVDGTSSERITFKAEPRRSAIVQGFNVRGKYVTIEGFNITRHPVTHIYDSNRNGISIYEASYLEIIDNYFYDIAGAGVTLIREGVTDVYIINNKMYKCAQGIDFSGRLSNNTLIENNEITRLYSWGELDNVTHIDNDFIRIGGEGFIIRNNYLHGYDYKEITYRERNSSTGDPYERTCTEQSDCNPPFFCAWDNYCRYNSHVDNIEVVSYAGDYSLPIPNSIRYVKNGLIENNIFYDSGQSLKIGTSQHNTSINSSNITIRNNIIAHASSNSINPGRVDGVKIYNNFFYNIWNAAVSISANPTTDYIITNGSVIFKNNILYNNRIFAMTAQGEETNFTEENNLLYKVNTVNSNLPDFTLSSKSSELLEMYPYIKNMPLLVNPLNMIDVPSSTQFIIDSSFDSDVAIGDIVVYKNDGVERTITNKELQGSNLILTVDTALEDYDIINFMINNAPSHWHHFLEIWPAGSNITYDFSLLSNSPAIDNGVDLSEEGFNSDFDGNLRESGAWDIGAYEYVSNEIWADNCSQEAVQQAIDSASDGDTVRVPAGECVWGGTVSIPSVNIILQGQGINNTIINGSGIRSLSSGSRITGFSFNYGKITLDGNGWRVDHCSFYDDVFHAGVHARGLTSIHPTGVIDHNEFYNTRVLTQTAALLTEGEDQHILWAEAFPYGESNYVYAEDNNFYFNVHANAIDANTGTRYVFRNNFVEAGYIEAHSVQGTNRGTRRWEIYDNQINNNGSYIWYPFRMRGGTGVIFGNNISGHWTNTGIAFDNVRDYADVGPGLCNGSVSGWDGNVAGQDGWPCRDQIGRGKDNVQWDDNPLQNHSQTSEPAYVWNNLYDGIEVSVKKVNTGGFDHIQEGRDYFDGIMKPGYKPYIYPHPLTTAPFGTEICGEGPISSECWCEGSLRTEGTCEHGYYFTSSGCNHPADTSPNNCVIDINELTTYVNSWKSDLSISINEVMDAISKWKAGGY